jgi:hypothetical protein
MLGRTSPEVNALFPWQPGVRALLESRGYPSYAIEHTIEHVARHGTADVGPALLGDREDVEAIVAGDRSAVADALEAIERKRREWADEHDCHPLQAWQAPLACWLQKRTYTDRAIHVILDHCARFGTAQCCRWLEAEDVDGLERQLPRVPECVWLRYESEVWNPNG